MEAKPWRRFTDLHKRLGVLRLLLLLPLPLAFARLRFRLPLRPMALGRRLQRRLRRRAGGAVRLFLPRRRRVPCCCCFRPCPLIQGRPRVVVGDVRGSIRLI